MSDYFKFDAIGSSILGRVIMGFLKKHESPVLCCDLAAVPVKPTQAMEIGKQFEDLVEQEYSGKPVFDNKYFISDISKIPEYRGETPDVMQILHILDSDNIEEEVKRGYIWNTKPDKKSGQPKLNKTYKQRHSCLDQIIAHDYRRPIPAPLWKKLQIMLERFRNYPFSISGMVHSLHDWMTNSNIDVEFQVEYFWKHDCDAECRAKFDMILTWKINGDRVALLFDLKVTQKRSKFEQFWRDKYVWQAKHYLEGFKKWCAENNYIPIPLMWFLIQENEEPYITSARALSPKAFNNMTISYNEAVFEIWEWIKAGKPIRGYMPQQIVDRYGREIF